MIGTSDWVQVVGYLAWPVTTCIIVGLLVWTRAGTSLLAGIGGRVKNVRALGIELDLEPATAGKVKVDLEEQFSSYRATIRKRFDGLNHQHDIIRLRDLLVEEVIQPEVTVQGASLRCTIYVPDIVFSDALYRLTDYYPDGGESGKVYSIRFGIIGRQWRLRESVYEPEVTRDSAVLMRDWGMTKAQANATSNDQAFLIAMLSHEGVEEGLVFVSSEVANPFADHGILESVVASEHTHALAKRVALVNTEMRERGPALRLFDE